MSRYITPARLDLPRSQIHLVYSSDPAFPVPSWARIAYVTGCGGGGSASSAGNYGGAGAFAIRHPILLPVGLLSLDVQIGSGGLSSAGGSTSLRGAGVLLLWLGGGSSNFAGGCPGAPYSTALSAAPGLSLDATFGTRFNPPWSQYTAASTGQIVGDSVAGASMQGVTLFVGSSGAFATRGNSQSGWNRAAGSSAGAGPFGIGGGLDGFGNPTIAATGYGVGAGNGLQAQPGFLQIEFVEVV